MSSGVAVNTGAAGDIGRARRYPLDRIVDLGDVAAAVAFRASPQAGAITGVCLPVDCGLTAGQDEVARTFSQSEHT